MIYRSAVMQGVLKIFKDVLMKLLRWFQELLQSGKKISEFTGTDTRAVFSTSSYII